MPVSAGDFPKSSTSVDRSGLTDLRWAPICTHRNSRTAESHRTGTYSQDQHDDHISRTTAARMFPDHRMGIHVLCSSCSPNRSRPFLRSSHLLHCEGRVAPRAAMNSCRSRQALRLAATVVVLVSACGAVLHDSSSPRPAAGHAKGEIRFTKSPGCTMNFIVSSHDLGSTTIRCASPIQCCPSLPAPLPRGASCIRQAPQRTHQHRSPPQRIRRATRANRRKTTGLCPHAEMFCAASLTPSVGPPPCSPAPAPPWRELSVAGRDSCRVRYATKSADPSQQPSRLVSGSSRVPSEAA